LILVDVPKREEIRLEQVSAVRRAPRDHGGADAVGRATAPVGPDGTFTLAESLHSDHLAVFRIGGGRIAEAWFSPDGYDAVALGEVLSLRILVGSWDEDLTPAADRARRRARGRSVHAARKQAG
jgi:hypothetical protein